ncbi:aminoglycoside phosphotransferase family protein [Streptomyces sp. SL13]|uniref:Aminoglycoside phosphotransferase family protein n=1 Tax=Streptantibioticus silvisoli TaxID=2705255 RepID=A0AA90H3X6_9ACTN|nr:aminoglycoside phosphotransferase family protein [Streptantibioticus silvisoli]MDI5971526.1 aminoglycoside phosphotransferase family protein [Streptantibioticus silvisoli]
MTASERTTFGPETAESILRRACAVAAVDPDGIQLLRLGDHAVFRIDGGRTIARAGRGPERLPSVEREVRVAGWLAAEKYPAARLATDAEQPVVVDGHPVTFWEGLADGESYATTGEMGVLLRRLHDLGTPDFTLPDLRPFEKVRSRLERAQISEAARTYLLSLAEELETDFSGLDFALPAGPVHGDFNVGNVLHDNAGQPRVIDLDGFALGPREWDLMQTAMYYDSFGWHTEAEYDDFVAGYGWDVRTWSGYDVMRHVRELLMVTWLSQNAANPRAAAEVEKRVASLRTGSSRRDWAPY